ncbi:hypothetical protein T01_7932 [Trichinella spiralis]|uniref:FLYWCH-type domain-containing protein n=1 Tax=Trichinella spiralis TaxID=6334 RepID=A0A0V1AM76_TRISP|nr:hypothetical protein T01_7932 [Trichinella spiralis]
MADVPELHLVPNRCGGTSLVHEGRAYKLKRAGIQKYWRCSKRNVHIESCRVDEHLAYKMEKKAVLKKRSAEETKLIPAIYDDEASAASAAPSTSGYFPLSKRVKSTMYRHRAKRYPKLPKHRGSASRHILVFAAGSNIKMLAARRTWGMLEEESSLRKQTPAIKPSQNIHITPLISKQAIMQLRRYPQIMKLLLVYEILEHSYRIHRKQCPAVRVKKAKGCAIRRG